LSIRFTDQVGKTGTASPNPFEGLAIITRNPGSGSVVS
jgi:hypothetical protein